MLKLKCSGVFLFPKLGAGGIFWKTKSSKNGAKAGLLRKKKKHNIGNSSITLSACS